MPFLPADLTLAAFSAALAIAGLAGFVKGALGFAMPMIMIAAFSSFLSPETALAGLIVPTIVTNISQALRQGLSAAVQSARTYQRFVIATLIMLFLSAQLVFVIPQHLFLLLLGVPITAFAAWQLAGGILALNLSHRSRAEWVLGAIGGLYGGISGVWGPPLIVYLLSTGTPKAEVIRVQGVVFLLGAIVLLLAHAGTGVITAQTLAFSAALAIPALAGQGMGFAVQDRLDHTRFRTWTLLLLLLTGLNLMFTALA